MVTELTMLLATVRHPTLRLLTLTIVAMLGSITLVLWQRVTALIMFLLRRKLAATSFLLQLAV